MTGTPITSTFFFCILINTEEAGAAQFYLGEKPQKWFIWCPGISYCFQYMISNIRKKGGPWSSLVVQQVKGHCCGLDLIPGPGTLGCCKCSKKKRGDTQNQQNQWNRTESSEANPNVYSQTDFPHRSQDN